MGKVQAGTEAGWGERSAVVVDATRDGLPDAPTSLRLTARNESCLSLAWNEPVNNSHRLTAYKVETGVRQVVQVL